MEPTGITLTANEIARLEGITAFSVRRKYFEQAEYLDENRHVLYQLVPVRGGRQIRFDLAVLDRETQAKYRSQEKGDSTSQDSKEVQNPGLPAANCPLSDTTALGTHGDEALNKVRVRRTPKAADLSKQVCATHLDANPAQAEECSGQLAAGSGQMQILRCAQNDKRKAQNDSQPEGYDNCSAQDDKSGAGNRFQLTLNLYDDSVDANLAPLPAAKRPLAKARWKIIERAVDDKWRVLIGQTLHGITIRNLDHYVQALAKDSGHGKAANLQNRSALLNWAEIDEQLRVESKDPSARISPVSPRTLWRFISWFKRGKAPSHCPLCGAAIADSKSPIPEGADLKVSATKATCEQGHAVEPLRGMEALQDLDRSDKGNIDLHPAHAEHLVSLFCSGDRTVKKSRLALQRPRSAQECWERLKLEIELGGDLPTPPPSLYVVRRFYNEALPAILRRISQQGLESGWLKNKVYIPYTRANCQVNDAWLCDFRRTNLSTWVELDGKLHRVYCCAIMDTASRDVIVCYDFFPSARLFKSTLRLALLTWGIPKEIWMDNGKEFTCEEVVGEGMRTWQERFECDDDAKGIFRALGVEPHYCIKYNPDGKACLERFFQQFDKLERNLPGWCGEKPVPTKGNFGRPDRWKHEVKLHKVFCANELPETPLWTTDQLIQFETRWLGAKYRAMTRLHGHGLGGRTPAQIQAAFKGVREIPNPAQLDLLLWYRRRVTARGDKVSIDYHKRTLIYRSDALLALTGDCEIEVHVDPINAERAIALDPLGKVPPIVLEACEPRERSQDALSAEMERQQGLRKRMLGATLVASRLAPVRGPEEYLALIEQKAKQKTTALDASTLNPAHQEVELPAYATVQKALCAAGPRAQPMTSEPVVTVDPRDLKDVEDMFRR